MPVAAIQLLNHENSFCGDGLRSRFLRLIDRVTYGIFVNSLWSRFLRLIERITYGSLIFAFFGFAGAILFIKLL